MAATMKRLLSSIRLANSLYSTQLTRFHPNNQVRTRLPTSISPFLNLHGRTSFFSSKPEQTLTLILSQNWSENLEQQLSSSKSDFTHESVMYVLKKLSKDPKKASAFFDFIVGKLGFQPSSAMYSLMLRLYGNKESIKQLWITAQRMKEGGFFIDDQSYLLILRDFKNAKMVNEAALLTKFYNSMVKDEVVDQIVGVLIQSDWGNEVEKRLKEMNLGWRLSDNFVLRVLKGLRSHPLKALGFFKWVNYNFGYEHNAVTYNAILRVLGREDSLNEFWSTFDEMKNAGHEMDLDTYLKVTRLFQKRKMFQEAVDLYERMMDGPYKPSIQDCSLLLRNLAGNRSPDLHLVFRVVNKFKETGNSLSKSVYDGIHRSLTSVGQFAEAEKITVVMKEAGYDPDNITYSQLIFGLCKARRLEEASEVIEQMESNGCIPDIKTWTILIQGHCSANEVEKALVFLANMVEKGCEADADLLDVLVNGFLSQENVISAHRLLVEMVESGGVKPWQATYKGLIQTLLAGRLIEEALAVLRLMKKHGYPPFSEAFVGYLSKFGTVDECLEFLKALSSKESPSILAFQNVFQGLFDEGREMEAKDLLFKCPPHVRKHKGVLSLFGSIGSFR